MRVNFCHVAINIATFSSAASASSFSGPGAKKYISPRDLQTPTLPTNHSATNISYVDVRVGQVLFQFCPEFVGKPKRRCLDCGGDKKVKGFCDNVSKHSS
jgi:hypothetical protein